MTHTPGPWIVGGACAVRTTLSSTDWVARTRDVHHKHSDEEDAANAILIAAAPDMRLALEHVRDGKADMNEVVAAIDKAEGRTA